MKRRLWRAAPLWRAYERQVLSELTERYRGVATVSYDEFGRQRLAGRYSGITRQIDVLVRGRLTDDLTHATMVVDCKLHQRPITVKHVEAFAGMIDDVGADMGLLVTSAGYTLPARRRAASCSGLTLEVLRLDELADWLRRNPHQAVTSGASTGTFTYWDESGVLRTDTAPVAVVRAAMQARPERHHPVSAHHAG